MSNNVEKVEAWKKFVEDVISREKTIAKLEKGQILSNGAKVIDFRPATTHSDDMYLLIVIAEYSTQYVTWLYNECGQGTHYGNYFDNFLRAWQDFNTRGVYS